MTAGRVGAGRGGGWVKMMDSGIGKYACVSQTQRFSEDDLIQRMTKKVRKMQMEETQNVEAQRRKRFETVRQVFLGPTDERHTRFGGRDASRTLPSALAHSDAGGKRHPETPTRAESRHPAGF